jgi:CRP-like cAMP-binding protein
MSSMAMTPTPLHPPIKTKGMQIVEHEIGEPIEIALHRLYVLEGLDQKAIADKWGLDRATVSRWMRDFRINTRR